MKQQFLMSIYTVRASRNFFQLNVQLKKENFYYCGAFVKIAIN